MCDELRRREEFSIRVQTKPLLKRLENERCSQLPGHLAFVMTTDWIYIGSSIRELLNARQVIGADPLDRAKICDLDRSIPSFQQWTQSDGHRRWTVSSLMYT